MRLSVVRLAKRLRAKPMFRPAIDLPEMLSFPQPVRPEQGITEPTFEEYEQAVVHPRLLNKYLHAEDPLHHEDFFGVANLFTMADLFDARIHYGHKVGTLNPKMKHYLYGSRMGTCIFDLRQTAHNLQVALNFIAHVAFRDGLFLFSAHDRLADLNMHKIEAVATQCGEFAHTRKWKEGTFLNSQAKFGMDVRLPDCVIMTRTHAHQFTQHMAVFESVKMLIPVVAVVDSNCDPNLITYPIPGNDDSEVAVEFWLKMFTGAIELGKSARRTLESGASLQPAIIQSESQSEKKLQIPSSFVPKQNFGDSRQNQNFADSTSSADIGAFAVPPTQTPTNTKSWRELVEQLNKQEDKEETSDVEKDVEGGVRRK